LLHSKLKTLFLAAFVILLALALISFPKESLEASIRGLDMWWKVVFPSLLPFFIVSELLIGFGVVKFIGVLLEPLMRPLFRVPGVGGFVWAMGLASGFPAGAKLTSRLYQEKQLTKVEAERLVSFTNASNPLFIFGAISVGFFHNPAVGLVLAISHYLGNFCVGLMMRFYGPNELPKKNDKKSIIVVIREALRTLHHTRLNEKRPFGKLLGDAVSSSIQTLLMVGGFIILFSVFTRLLSLVNISDGIAFILSSFLLVLGISPELSIPLISGLFEITSGSEMASQTKEASLLNQIMITSFILGFSGLSVQAQVASILAETKIGFKPFFVGRIFQGFLAAFFTFLLWKPLYINIEATIERGNIIAVLAKPTTHSWLFSIWNVFLETGPILTIMSLLLYILIYAFRLKLVGRK